MMTPRPVILAVASALSLAPLVGAQTVSQDERNQRFLQNLAITCEHVTAATKPTCDAVVAEYKTENVNPKSVPIGPVLKKILIEIAKKLAGLGSAVTAAVGIVFVGEPIATEIHDIESESIALSLRRAGAIRDMSFMKRDDFTKFLANSSARADKIISVLNTK